MESDTLGFYLIFIFMFWRTNSPRGGRRMGDLMTWPTGEQNVKLKLEPIPQIVANFHCLWVGYADKDMKVGDKLWLKPDDALHLYKLLKKEFE